MPVTTVPAGASARTRSFRAAEATAWFEYSLACSTDCLEQAFRLVHDQYVARGYMRRDPSGWRLGVHHALPAVKVFVARRQRRIVGTLALIPDSAIGLPMDGLYGRELLPFREQGRYIAEVSSLAITEDCRTSGLGILASLVRQLLLYAIEVGRCDDICIAVNPRHVRFYRRLFPHAQEIGERRAYDKVNGAPAIALRIDLRLLAALIPAIQRGTANVGEAYRFFFHAEDSSAIVARLRSEASRAQLTPRQFRHFFSAHPALARASATARAFVQSLNPAVDVDAIVEAYRAPRDQPVQADFDPVLVPA
jgi:GNAT superfamily N-acetyltransferase